MTSCQMVVVFGTETFGRKTSTGFSTYEELMYITSNDKPYFLIKMCQEFAEPATQFAFPNSVAYYWWFSHHESDPPDRLIADIERKFKSISVSSSSRYQEPKLKFIQGLIPLAPDIDSPPETLGIPSLSTTAPVTPPAVSSSSSSSSSSLSTSPTTIPEAELRELALSVARCNYVSVVVIGEGGAGKTSTCLNMIGKPRGCDSTVGIDCYAVNAQVSKNGRPVFSRIAPSEKSKSNHFKDGVVNALAGAQAGSKSILNGVSPAKNSGSASSSSASSSLSSSSASAAAAAAQASLESKNNPPSVKMDETVISAIIGETKVSVSDVNAAKDKPVEYHIIYFDCGGQDAYRPGNSWFMTPQSVGLIIFDLQQLAQKPDHAAKIEAWVKDFSVHTPKSPILLVATRGDIHKADGRVSKEQNNVIRRMFENTTYWKRMVKPQGDLCFFLVDNKESNDAGIETLKQAVLHTISTHENYQKEYPLAYLKVLDVIVEQKEKTMPMDDFREKIASKYGIRSDEEIKTLCEVLCQLGFVAYFPMMTDIVLKPASLIDAIACLTRNDVGFHSKKSYTPSKEIREQLDAFNNTGKLTREVIHLLWENELGLDDRDCEVFLNLLVNLNLVIEDYDNTSSTAEKSKVVFIAPSKTPISSSEVSDVADNISDRSVCRIKFRDSSSELSVYLIVIFFRLVAKLHNLCQSTSDFKPRLARNEAIVTIGETLMHLQALPASSEIKLVIGTKRPCEVLSMMELLLDEIPRENFPALSYDISFDVTLANGRKCTKELRELKASIAGGKALLADDGSKLSVTDFADWIRVPGSSDRYDGFISYRVKSDETRANLLYWCLVSDGKMNIFLDAYCLKMGKQWDKDFAMALKNSTVALPLITQANIDTMAQKLQADVVDHVLMEWMLMLIFYERKMITSIMPLFENDSLYTSKKASNMKSLEKISTVTSQECIAMLKFLGVSLPEDEAKITNMMVSTVYDSLCKFQALNLEAMQSAVAGRSTDWKLYVKVATRVKKEREPSHVKSRTFEVEYGLPSVASALVADSEIKRRSEDSFTTNENLRGFAVRDIGDFLRSHEFEEYADVFLSNKINGMFLLAATCQEMREYVVKESHFKSLRESFNAVGPVVTKEGPDPVNIACAIGLVFFAILVSFFWNDNYRGFGMICITLWCGYMVFKPKNSTYYFDLGLKTPVGGSIRLSNGSTMTKRQCFLKVIEMDPENRAAYPHLATTLPFGGSILLPNGQMMTKTQLQNI